MPASLPFLRGAARRFRSAALCALCTLLWAPPSAAQPPRPWLDWRTVETENFVFHFPERYRTWTVALMERMEGVRGQVARIVGYVPPHRVHVVVDDPANDANGTAFTPLDAPTIILWPTPPDPREEIGNFRNWAELLATHEFAHVAHLGRPSRNRWKGLLWDLSPVPLGPIASNAPRWAIEGFATYVEGRVTGSGRPNNAWRAAYLRQFALEGRLPSYAQLNGSAGWEGGNFAYLAGSAFLEWLARREGDSSVTALWRRMTAKTTRSFDEAFAGVYGGGPAELYGRFAAAVTGDALSFDRALARDALVQGTLIQRLTRKTGDPAVSPDGRFVALVVRRQDAPSRLVVWGTADEPDTLTERRRLAQLAVDPDDVPDRAFHPAPKRVIISLVAGDGASYESPRWLPDNRRLLVSRRMPLRDGTIRPDLFIWSAEDGTLSRLTHGAALKEPDPSADGTWAAAIRCDRGWCDLVRVDLTTGAIRVIIAGDVGRNYYRPRVSRVTGEIAVAEQLGDRWRIARVNAETGALTYADPDDGVTRYDATYATDGRTIVATSEARGIANLERLDVDGRVTRLTAVTGAAVAVDVAPDGALWFLNMQANGFDLRRLVPDSASIARAAQASAPLHLALVDSLSPVLPPRGIVRGDSTRRPVRASIGDERGYGIGDSRYRYVPGITSGYGGSTLLLALVRSDPVGRVGGAFIASAGAGSLPTGFAFELATRQMRTAVTLNGWLAHEAPSRIFAGDVENGLDLTRAGGALRFQRTRARDGADLAATLTLLGERHLPSFLTSVTRASAIGHFSAVLRQRDEGTRYQEQLTVLAEGGGLGGHAYLRQRSSLFFGTGYGSNPLTTIRVSYGTLGGSQGVVRERFVIGGFSSPLLDPMLDARRVDAPAYPAGSASAVSFGSFRAAVPIAAFELFYSGASTDLFRTALRSYGLELRQRVGAIPALGTPTVDALMGFARAADAPVEGEWRYYITLALRP